MSGTWLPGLLVLALGLAAGLGIAWRIRRQPATPKRARRLELQRRIGDLESRRDELYQRLRAPEGREMEPGDRAELEDAAAAILRDLDRERHKLAAFKAGRATARGRTEPAGRRAVAPSPRKPFLAGYGAGLVSAGLIGLLVYWAFRDAEPALPAGGAAPANAQATVEHPQPALPEETARTIAALEARVAEEPRDLGARKELALELLWAEQYLPAFQHAQEILRMRPEDPDGLYVQAIVRMTMGQSDMAVALLDRLLGSYPDHVSAWTYRGVALAREGDQAGAIESWRRGLSAAGGSHPELERLLDTVVEGPVAAAGEGDRGGELDWDAPAGWMPETPASSTRRAQYRVPGAGGDGECIVFFFGPGQGGDAISNARRWADQFQQPEGRPSTEAMKTERIVANGIPVLLVEVTGTYLDGMPGAGARDVRPDSMLVGAVAESATANWFFKLVGPARTVEQQRPAFEAMIRSLRSGSASG